MRSSSEKVRWCRFYNRTPVNKGISDGLKVTYSAGISQKVWANRLDVAVGRSAELADGLEVFLASPSSGKDGQWQCDLHGRGHCALSWWWGETQADNFWLAQDPSLALTDPCADLGPQKASRNSGFGPFMVTGVHWGCEH